MTQLRWLITAAAEAAGREFEQCGSCAAVYFCLDGEGRAYFVPPPAGDKDCAIATIKAFMEHAGIVSYCFAGEAWTLQVRAESIDRLPLPSQHPDRVEVVTFIAENAAGMLSGQRRIERPAGRSPFLGPLQIEAFPRTEGRMVGLLPRREGRLH